MQERQLNSSNQFMISSTGRQLQDRRGNRPNIPSDELGLKCPRCDSSNTKFCYYNNYNLAQPRHFCKTCKRYWTKGGALRNVPVGGGCRKNKRAKQKSADQSPASLALAVEESLLSTIHCDRPIASSSASLDFSVGSASSRQDLIFVAGNAMGEEGIGLTFEKLDQGSRSFTGSSPRPPSLSINWAAAAPSTATLQPFQSSILGINLSGLHQSKQEPVNLYNNGDLSSIFDPQLNLLGPTSPQLTDNLRSYNNQLGLDSFGLMQASPSNGDIQWRLPPPRLVTMVEGAHGYPDGRLLRHHTSVENLQPDNLRNTRKLSIPEEMQVSTMAENQEADRLPVMWQPHPEASLFDATTGDGSAYWSSSSWPQHEMYEDDQLG